MKGKQKLISLSLAFFQLAGLLTGCHTNPTLPPAEPEILRPDTYKAEAIGSDAYLSLDRMAFIDAGTFQYGVSSAGRDNGNSDGFNGQNWLYIDENGDHVICEAYGRGIVNRIWTTGTYNEQAVVKIYIDNKEEPVYSGAYYNFTKGVTKPFLYPIAKFWNQSAGGRLNYLPIAFSSYVKIAIEDPGQTNLFWHVDYALLDEDHEVQPWTGTENISALLDMWNNAGLDFKSGTGVKKDAQAWTFAAGEETVVLQLQGARQIQSIKITLDGLKLPTTANQADANKSSTNMREELNGLRLKIYWDGETSPSVDCALSTFFGIGTLGYNNSVNGLFYGVENETMYNYFPMPFQKSAKVVIENETGKPIDATVDIRHKPVDYDFYNVGYFKTCEKNFYVNAQDPLELCLLQTTGSGKIVNIQLNAFGNPGGDVRYEEGDVRIYVDGSRTPQIVSPGMEDFFNGAGYFIDQNSKNKRGLYTTELSGYTNWHVTNDRQEAISVYRVFAADAITFRNGISFCIEHGGGDRNPNSPGWHQNQSAGYETLICYYHSDVSRMQQTDMLKLGEETQKESHGFVGTTVEDTSVTSGFWSGFDLVEQSMSGISYADDISFEMALNPKNYGAVLYRVFDQAEMNDGVVVYVDGTQVGTWYKAGYNTTYQLCEDAFLLPASLTSGKEKVKITLSPLGQSSNLMQVRMCCIADEPVDPVESFAAEIINICVEDNALTLSDGVLTMGAVDPVGRSDFRVVAYHDGSVFLINSFDGSVLCAREGQLASEKIAMQKLGRADRWVLEKTEGGYLLKNLADNTYISTEGTLTLTKEAFVIRTVTERKQNIF